MARLVRVLPADSAQQRRRQLVHSPVRCGAVRCHAQQRRRQCTHQPKPCRAGPGPAAAATAYGIAAPMWPLRCSLCSETTQHAMQRTTVPTHTIHDAVDHRREPTAPALLKPSMNAHKRYSPSWHRRELRGSHCGRAEGAQLCVQRPSAVCRTAERVSEWVSEWFFACCAAAMLRPQAAHGLAAGQVADHALVPVLDRDRECRLACRASAAECSAASVRTYMRCIAHVQQLFC
jgi:hypothetical protein